MRTGHSTTTLHIVYRLKDTLQAIVVAANHLENQNIFIGSPALSCTSADQCVTQKSKLHRVGHTRLDWTGLRQHYPVSLKNNLSFANRHGLIQFIFTNMACQDHYSSNSRQPCDDDVRWAQSTTDAVS